MSLVKAGAISLWCERAGAGAPLVMVTGLGYASWCWEDLRARLRDRFELLTFDNRGTGRSDKPAGPYSMAMMADDVAALMQSAGLRRAHVLGHSMGGYISLTLALRHPARVRSLTLVGTSRGGPDAQPVPDETLRLWSLAGTMPALDYTRLTMPNSFAPGWAERHPAQFEAIVHRRLEFPTPRDCWQAQYEACVEFVVKGADVTGLHMPALVIHGEQDRVVPHHNGALLARDLPSSRFVSLPASGHLPILEEPDTVAQLIREHLEQAK